MNIPIERYILSTSLGVVGSLDKCSSHHPVFSSLKSFLRRCSISSASIELYSIPAHHAVLALGASKCAHETNLWFLQEHLNMRRPVYFSHNHGQSTFGISCWSWCNNTVLAVVGYIVLYSDCLILEICACAYMAWHSLLDWLGRISVSTVSLQYIMSRHYLIMD